MEVKGTAFLARKAMLEKEHGAAKFDELLRDVAKTNRVFLMPILATTRIPIDAFLRFNEAVVKRLYAGDELSYFRFGEASAAWALAGPYKQLVTNKSVEEFAASAAAIYRNYFTEGEARSSIDGHVVTLRLVGIDAPHRHVYFEYAIMGYFKRGLEIVSGHPVKMIAQRGFSKRDPDVVYRFEY